MSSTAAAPPEHPPAPPAAAIFAIGFRPFFVGAGVFATLALAFWTWAWWTGAQLTLAWPAMTWHGHEMVFGYSFAVVAGFFLTAVRNWTGVNTCTPRSLAALCAVWGAARLLPLAGSSVPMWLIAAVDLAFLPALAMLLLPPLWRPGQGRNWWVLPLLGVMTAANALFHCEYLGLAADTARPGMYLGIDCLLVLIVAIAGRIMPFFTRSAIPDSTPRHWPALDAAAVLLLIALLPAAHGLFGTAPRWLVTALAVAAVIVHSIRLGGWWVKGVVRLPLLLVLYAGYLWLIAGMALTGAAAHGIGNIFVALHAFTVGGIGVMTLGMMARVGLGHTGRPLRPNGWTIGAFVLLNIAAAARVLLPLVAPPTIRHATLGSGALWTVAFAVFAVVYTPICWRPRPDGKPG
jgi:uncharacterized protein involved in response to NO